MNPLKSMYEACENGSLQLAGCTWGKSRKGEKGGEEERRGREGGEERKEEGWTDGPGAVPAGKGPRPLLSPPGAGAGSLPAVEGAHTPIALSRTPRRGLVRLSWGLVVTHGD